MDSVIKGLLYIGTVAAVGQGVFAWFVGPESATGAIRTRLTWGLLLGAALVLVLSPLQVVATLSELLGSFDPNVTAEYLFNTRHGAATLVRLGAVLLLVTASLLLSHRGVGRLLFLLSALLLLGSFSWTSHAVTVGGSLPLFGDLLHFAAGAVWAGAVLYTAWLPLWGTKEPSIGAVKAVERVSRLGLACVALLTFSGLYTALLHVRTPEILATSAYGRILVLKTTLVLVIVGVAAANRWLFLPRLRARVSSSAFVRLFRLEAVLLLAVLALSGLLTTSALPHEAGLRPDPLESLRNFLPR